MANALGVSTSMVNRIECGNVNAGRRLTELMSVMECPARIDSFVEAYRRELQRVAYFQNDAHQPTRRTDAS